MNAKAKAKAFALFVAGSISGAAILFTTLLWSSNPKEYDPLAAGKIDECKRVTEITGYDSQAYRALKISDCMSANGFVFIGTGADSRCFAKNPIHVLIKHLMPNCYIPQSGFPRLSIP